MPVEKLCLIVDNENQEGSIEKIVRASKAKGITIKVIEFKVGNTEFTEVLDENGRINIDKVIKYYRVNYRKMHFDLIAFDWDLNDEAIDGIELIRQFRNSNFLKKTPVALYSGELQVSVKGYFDAYKNNQKSFNESWNKIKTLIDVPIMGFYDRSNYENKIVEAIQSFGQSVDIEHYFLKKLKENEKLIFNNINPKLEGRTFGQVAEIIEKNPTYGNNFITELVDQTIAYLLKMNPRN